MQFTSDIEWYVMRATYQRELITQRVLDSMGIENFVPTALMEKTKEGLARGVDEAQLHFHSNIYPRTARNKDNQTSLPTLPDDQWHQWRAIGTVCPRRSNGELYGCMP